MAASTADTTERTTASGSLSGGPAPPAASPSGPTRRRRSSSNSFSCSRAFRSVSMALRSMTTACKAICTLASRISRATCCNLSFFGASMKAPTDSSSMIMAFWRNSKALFLVCTALLRFLSDLRLMLTSSFNCSTAAAFGESSRSTPCTTARSASSCSRWLSNFSCFSSKSRSWLNRALLAFNSRRNSVVSSASPAPAGGE
mmetsp:Transcript_128403/g.411605  ORF Transcript_128403/g.411605 Transcript_128403/m.411605 type:complete len:201 (-) Transcript_128403:1721-2323(-)